MNTPQRSLLRSRRLLDELMFLSIYVSTAILILVQLVSFFVISDSMTSDLKGKAQISAEEVSALLVTPLYELQDDQSVRIGEALLFSGRISGIRLISDASGILLDKHLLTDTPQTVLITKKIEYNGMLLGTVELHFGIAEVEATQRRLVVIAVLVVLAGIVANFFAYRYVIKDRALRPLAVIFEGIGAIAGGNYDTQISESQFSDVNLIIKPMNEMASRVRAKNLELLEANTHLEHRVGQRTAELQKSLTDLHLAQVHLIASEKLSTLGYLSAGMAHELNTPLGAILSSNRLLIDYFDKNQSGLVKFLLSLDERGRALYDVVFELGSKKSTSLDVPVSDRKKRKELQQEFESAGIPESGKAAEMLVDLGITDCPEDLTVLLNNPRSIEILSWVSNPLISRRMAEIVSVAAHKAANVVSALRSYLKPELKDVELTVDIEADIERVLLLMNNILRQNIHVQRWFSGATVTGSSDKLSQVWMNLIRNAAQAMEFKGDLQIRTETREGIVYVSFEDSGHGIPESIIGRIFEPFFTTKKEGEGMGLGLDICARIIESHGGTITVNSKPGRTVFTVMLPAAAKEVNH